MRKSIVKFASSFGIVVAITFAWLVYVEAVCFTRLHFSDPGTDLIPRERLRAVYKGMDWADAMADEWKPSNQYAYKAYVGWERKPFAGRAITSMSLTRAARIMFAASAIPRGWCSRSIHRQSKPIKPISSALEGSAK